MIRVGIILLSVLLMSCNNSEKKSNRAFEQSMNQPSKSLSELKSLVLNKGDVKAYDELIAAYLDESNSEEFLLYAIIMANKFNYPQAYFDVYSCLVNVFYSDITKIDENTAALAITYLEKAAKKGHEQAQEMVKEFSINSKIPDKRKLVIEMYN